VGAAVGLAFGLGVFLLLNTGRPRRARPASRWRNRRTDMLRQAGLDGITPGRLAGLQAGTGLVVAVAMLTVTRTAPVAAAFGVFGAMLPVALVQRQRRRRAVELRDVWPEAVDNLASAVRAGLSLPEALSALGTRGPEPLREPFNRFGADYRASGRFGSCLDRLKDSLADPVADRILESLRMAREVGGTDLGRLLRTLSAFLREDARARAELETRQGWTVNAARLAVAAPWAVLLLLATQSQTIQAYNSAGGVVVLAVGGVVSFAAYRLMLQIGRLPEDQRVLR
jgi:tight adherence protein B